MKSLVSVACLVLVACSSTSTTPGGTGTTPTATDGGTTPSTGRNACGETDADPKVGGLPFCEACTNSTCCTEIQSCAASDACSKLQTCLTKCQQTDRSCTGACSNLYPDGVSTYNNQTNCAAKCSQPCSTPPAGCTHDALGTAGRCAETPFPLLWSCPSGAPSPQCVASPDGVADDYCCLQ